VLEADAGHGDAEIERQVRVAPNVKAHRVSPASHIPLGDGVHAVEVAPPDREHERHADDRRGGRCRAPVLLATHAGHHGNHRLAEQDDAEQAVPFW